MRLLPAFAMLLAATPAVATEVVRLSDSQRDAVIAAAANGPERDPVLTPEQARRESVLNRSLYPEFYAEGGSQVRDRKVHGEMTMFAGSGGTFGMAGTAVVPVGETGSAAISVMKGTSRWGGLSGVSLGYSSNDSNLLIGNGFGGFGYGHGLGIFGRGPWTTPYGQSWNPALQMRRR